MAFDLDSLKGKTLDDKLFTDLQAAFADVTSRAETAEGKARAAQRESIDGRKQLKAERDAAFAKLGVESMEEIEALPDAKGQADAAKQAEAKAKKLERELADERAAHGEAKAAIARSRRESAIAKAVSKHGFIDSQDAADLLGLRVKEEGEELFYEGADGKRTSIDDAAAWLAKSKPHLVKPAGGDGGGSGAGKGGKGSATPPAKPERKDFPDEPSFFRAQANYADAQREAGGVTH